MYNYFFQLRARLEFYEALKWYGENSGMQQISLQKR
jgi:hypothetical protein